MKDQMTTKETQAFIHTWAKRLHLRGSYLHLQGSKSRVTILKALLKERLHLNNIEVEGLDCIIKCFDKVAYGGCGHFTRSQIEAWLKLEGANKASDFTSAIELIEELITIRGK